MNHADDNDRLLRSGLSEDPFADTKPVSSPNEPEPGKIAFTDARSLAAEALDEPVSLLDEPGLLDSGEVHIVAGDPGSGKSLFVVNLAAALAGGSPFHHLRRASDRPVRVLLMLAEFTRFRASQRVKGLLDHYGVQEDRLLVWTREDAPSWINLCEVTGGGDDAVLSRAEDLAGIVRRRGIRLVVIDTLSEVHDHDENDRKGMTLVLRALRIVASAGCAVVVVHHNRKSPSGTNRGQGSGSMADVRGSTALTAGVASILSVRREAEEVEGSHASLAVWVKHNYSSPKPRAFRFRLSDQKTGLISGMEAADSGGRKGLGDDEVLGAMEALGGVDVTSKAVAEHLAVSERTARQHLSSLHQGGKLPEPRPGERNTKLWSIHDEHEANRQVPNGG